MKLNEESKFIGYEDYARISPKPELEGNNASPEAIVDAKALLWETRDSIAVMLGMLRVIPMKQQQRNIEMFEVWYGLNGREEQTLRTLATRWNTSISGPHQIIKSVWDKLKAVGSPIGSALALHNILAKVADLEEIVGERAVVRPSLPSPLEISDILDRFSKRNDARKPKNRENQYPLALNPVPPAPCETKKETLVAVVCKTFDVSLEKFRGPGSYPRESRARHVAAYLLEVDFHSEFDEIGKLIGRSAAMAKHGKYQTARELKAGNLATIKAVETARLLYKKVTSPKSSLVPA